MLPLISWNEQLDRNSTLRDFSNWPSVPVEALPQNKRHVFLRRCQYVSTVISGLSVKRTARQFNVSASEIYRLLQRALACHENEAPMLTLALVPNRHMRNIGRQSPLPSLQSPSGSRGCFRYLLEHVPNLKIHLDNHISSWLSGKAYGQNITPKVFHSHFIGYLRNIGWDHSIYPFNEKLLGYQSCRNYLLQRVHGLSITKPMKRVVSPLSQSFSVLGELQIDEQKHDTGSALGIKHNGIISYIRLARCSLIIIMDRESEFILAHELVLADQINQEDMLNVLKQLRTPFELPKLKSSLFEYPPAASGDSYLRECIETCQLGPISLDNALVHLADSVKKFATEMCLTTYNTGLVKNPKRRNLLEYCFNRLNKATHRPRATTGSHVRDIKKEPRHLSTKPPKIMLSDLEDMLHTEVARNNTTAMRELMGLSPIEFLREKFVQTFWFSSFRAKERMTLFKRSTNVTLHAGVKTHIGNHINFGTLRYRFAEKIIIYSAREKVTAFYDGNDIRTLDIYRKDGSFVGKCRAPRIWMQRPLSIRTRKKIMSLVKEKKISAIDPHTEYFNYLLKHKESPSIALELVHAYRESGAGGPSDPIDRRLDDNVMKKSHQTNAFRWNINDAT